MVPPQQHLLLAPPKRVIAYAPSIQINFRPTVNPVGVINDQRQASHSIAKETFLEKLLVERKHVSDFEQVLKEIDFSSVGTIK